MRHLLADYVERANFAPGTRVAVARIDTRGAVDAIAVGTWPDGQAVSIDDSFYVASLAKQVTGAAIALLVTEGRLDPDKPVSAWLEDVPAWVGLATTRQLAHHTAGLPAAGDLEATIASDWTERAAMDALRTVVAPSTAPGRRYAYSNIGYILLAKLVAAVSGLSFAAFVAARLLEPYGIAGMGFVAGTPAFPQARLMGPPLPLTHGDGGLWATAPAFARWLQLQNADRLGLASVVEVDGGLDDGTSTGYGWGLGLRQHRGRPLLIHGGEWQGAAAKAVRCPTLGIAIVAMAVGAEFEQLNQLVTAIHDDSP